MDPFPDRPGGWRPDGEARSRRRSRVAGAVRRLAAREVEALREALRRAARALRNAWSRRPPPGRAAAIAFVAVAILAGALAVAAQVRLSARLPSERDWAALAALLEREARHGDVAAVSPHWAERARERLAASVPVLAQPRYAGEDLVGVRRVWMLSLHGVPGFSWQPELDLLQRGSRPEPAQRVGAFEVTRYDLAFPTLPLAFLADRLATADVFRGATRCVPEPGGAFRCAGARVAREIREVAGAARPCLVVTHEPGAPTTIAFPLVRVGRRLHGHAGALGAPAPLRVSVVLGGEEAGAAEVDAAGFAAFQVDTTRFAGERPLALVLTSPGVRDAGPLELCLDAMTLP